MRITCPTCQESELEVGGSFDYEPDIFYQECTCQVTNEDIQEAIQLELEAQEDVYWDRRLHSQLED